jgi:predicted amidophosphoribosyltransferase
MTQKTRDNKSDNFQRRFQDAERVRSAFRHAKLLAKLIFIRIGGSVWNIFLDIIFPRAELVAEIEKMDKTAFIKAVFGVNSGKILRDKISGVETPGGFQKIPSAISSGVYALLPYRNRYVRTAIWQIKYKGNRKIAALIADILSDALFEIDFETTLNKLGENDKNSLIIPIPLSRERRKERGYNQIELVMEECVRSKIPKIPAQPLSTEPIHARMSPTGTLRAQIHADLLQKIRNTSPQTLAMGRTARLHNLAGCFFVSDPTQIAGKGIILIDDVLTTGATFAEASKTLFIAGAHKVICVAIAH